MDFVRGYFNYSGKLNIKNDYHGDYREFYGEESFGKKGWNSGFTVRCSCESERKLPIVYFAGNPTKAMLGHNFDVPTLVDYREFFNEFFLEFNTQASNVKITELHYGVNVELDYPVAELLKSVLSLSRHKTKVIEDETKMFFNKSSELILYDKFREAQDKGVCQQLLDQYFSTHRILRVEKRWKQSSSLKRSFGGIDVFANDLLTQEFQLLMKHQFLNEVSKLEIRELENCLGEVEKWTASQIYLRVIMMYCDKNSWDDLNIWMKSIKGSNGVSKSTYYKVFNAIKAAFKESSSIDYKDELLKKIVTKVNSHSSIHYNKFA